MITSELRKAINELEAYKIQSRFKFTAYKTPIGFGGGNFLKVRNTLISRSHVLVVVVSRVHVKFSRNFTLENKNTLRIFHLVYILPNHKDTSPSTKEYSTKKSV